MKRNFNLLTALRASQVSALLMFILACLLLGDQLMPTLLVDDRNPVELTEVQEESESKKETEKEKEVEDSDEFLHSIQIHRFASLLLPNGHHAGLGSRSIQVSVSETPPPEFI